MSTLDSPGIVESIDRENMLQSIRDFPDQLQASWVASQQVAIPTHFIQARQIVILASGPEQVAAEIAEVVTSESATVPVIVRPGGELPRFVGSQSLVIGLTYTGHTPEVVHAFAQAGQRGAKLFGVSTGGEIAALCRKYRAPHSPIQYGSQPRAALGYLIVPALWLFDTLAFGEIGIKQSIDRLVEPIRTLQATVEPSVPSAHNPAKGLATHLLGRIPLLVSSERLRPVARRWAGQFGQNAKTIAWFETIPSLARTGIDSLGTPSPIRDLVTLVQLRSAWDSGADSSLQNSLRQVAAKARLPHEEVVAPSNQTLAVDLLSLVHLGDFTSYYLALLGGVDPSTPSPARQALDALVPVQG